MEAVAEHGLSVMLSSHLVSDLERVCDYLIVLVASPGAGRRGRRRPARHPPPAHRAAPRPGHAAGRAAGGRGEPHRPAEHARRPHRRADPRPGLDGRARSAWRTWSWPTWPGRTAPRRRPALEVRDDLADLAPVPRPRPRRCTAPSRRLRVALAVTGPRLRPRTARPGVFDLLTDDDLPLRQLVVMAVRPGPGRRLPGRAARRPRARGRHPPAGVDPERHPHPLAGGQAGPDRARGRGRDRGG